MAFARGKFGVEYNTTRQRDDGSSGLGWVFAVVALVALASFAWPRARRIVAAAADTDEETAAAALSQCGYACKTAIVMLLMNLSASEAEQALAAADGRISKALHK